MKLLLLLVTLAACTAPPPPQPLTGAPGSRHAVCLARCERRRVLKPDNGPRTCVERCAAYEGQ